MEFKKFESIARYSRDCIITEKIDGTNAQICITEDGQFLTGSRKRWITPENDNYGFSRWANENKEELMKLGVGFHYGEWWGQGIQCKYGMNKKIFSLFDVARWKDDEIRPKCCDVVPILFEGDFTTENILSTMNSLKNSGSVAVKKYNVCFDNPEGIVIFHKKGNIFFKKTFKNDEKGKSYGN
jgi:hypothetical protein